MRSGAVISKKKTVKNVMVKNVQSAMIAIIYWIAKEYAPITVGTQVNMRHLITQGFANLVFLHAKPVMMPLYAELASIIISFIKMALAHLFVIQKMAIIFLVLIVWDARIVFFACIVLAI